MPETPTITTYYDFELGTRARANEVDNNFLQHRGHNIPIEPLTATAGDNNYDLGSTDHRWRTQYLGAAPYINSVQINRFEITEVYDGSSTTDLVDPIGDLGRIAFDYTKDTDVRFQFIVPPLYKPGNRMSLTIKGYPATIGSTVFHSVARIHKVGVTDITGSSTPGNYYTGTATIANTTQGLFVEDNSLKLTDASGLIGSATVTVGDIISVKLQRTTSHVSDTNTGYWFLSNLFVNLND